MIKTVPSKVFNTEIDNWLRVGNGEVVEDIGNHYCSYFNGCAKCPLGDHLRCCDGLLDESMTTSDIKGVASKIVDFIISRCVYEDNK